MQVGFLVYVRGIFFAKYVIFLHIFKKCSSIFNLGMHFICKIMYFTEKSFFLTDGTFGFY